MAIAIAPSVAQLSVLFAPEFMPVGLAAKALIVGSEPFAEDPVEVPPQFNIATQAHSTRHRAQRVPCEEASTRKLSRFIKKKSVASIVALKLLRTCNFRLI